MLTMVFSHAPAHQLVEIAAKKERRCNPPSTLLVGAIVVFGDEGLRGSTIWIEKRKGRGDTQGRSIHEVIEWNVEEEPVLAAVFVDLPTGTYIVRYKEMGVEYRNAEVLVDAGEVSVMDWTDYQTQLA